MLLVKPMITLVQTKMADYKIQYQSKVNDYLNILHHDWDYPEYVSA